MKKKIEIPNSNYLYINFNIPNKDFLPFEYLNQKSVKKATSFIKKNNILLFHVHLDEIVNFDVIFHNIITLFRYAKKNAIPIGKTIQEQKVIMNIEYEHQNDISINDFISQMIDILTVLSLNNKTESYRYLYDKSCEFFDQKFQKNNLCDFQNDSCVCQRCGKNAHKTMGCCYEFYYSKFDRLSCFHGTMPLFNSNWLQYKMSCLQIIYMPIS